MPTFTAENWTERPVEGNKESFNTRTGQFEAYRRFRGPYEERFQFLQTILPQVTGGVDDPNFVQNYYNYPGIPGMVAYSAEISGHLSTSATGPGESLFYDKAEVRVTYKADAFTFFLTSGIGGQSPPTPDEAPTVKTQYSVSSETRTIKFKGDQVKKVDNKRQHEHGDFNFQLHLINFKVTYQETLYPNWTSILQNLGKMNNGILVVSDLVGVFPLGSAERGTVLYEGPSAVTKNVIRSWNATDNTIKWDLAWDITHSLVYNRHKWRRIPVGVEIPQGGGAEVEGVTYVYEDINLYKYSLDNFAFLRRSGTQPDPDDPAP